MDHSIMESLLESLLNGSASIMEGSLHHGELPVILTGGRCGCAGEPAITITLNPKL